MKLLTMLREYISKYIPSVKNVEVHEIPIEVQRHIDRQAYRKEFYAKRKAETDESLARAFAWSKKKAAEEAQVSADAEAWAKFESDINNQL